MYENDNIITITNKINLLINSFNLHNTTHPVLSKLWIDTLETYKYKLSNIEKLVEKCEKLIEQGDSLIEKLPHNISDPNINTILLISAILTSSYNENNENNENNYN
jgi:hypothetical protein